MARVDSVGARVETRGLSCSPNGWLRVPSGHIGGGNRAPTAASSSGGPSESSVSAKAPQGKTPNQSPARVCLLIAGPGNP